MAAALGMIFGAGMNALGGYAAEKTRQKSEHDQLLFQMYATHPEASGDPEAQKFLKKHLGPEGAELFGHISEASRKASEQFGQAFGGGGAQPTSPGVQVAMAGKGGPGIAPTSAPSNPTSGLQQRISRMETYMASPAFRELQPDQQKVATDIYNRAQSELGRMTTAQATEQGRQETMAQREQFHQDTLALQQQNRQFMQMMATAKTDEEKQQHFQSAQQNLMTQTENIGKMLTSATPSDPATVKALLNQRNAMARQLKSRAEAAGLDYDAEALSPLTIQEVPGWLKSHIGIGGSTPTLAADTSASATPDPLIGTSTKKPDGSYTIGGKKYVVKNGKVAVSE